MWFLVTCNSEFDSSFSLTPNFSWVFVNARSIATVLTVWRFVNVEKLLKQFGDSRSPITPLKRGVNERNQTQSFADNKGSNQKPEKETRNNEP